MAKFFRQDLKGFGNGPTPPLEPLNGLRLMRRNPVEAVMRAQDMVTAMSRRIVASGGLRGSRTWRTPDTPVDGTHPAPTERRLIGAGCVDLTPGCMLKCWVVAVPCGMTTVQNPVSLVYEERGTFGRCEVDVVWTDATGTQVTTTHGALLPENPLANGAEPSPMWSHLYEFDFECKPPGIQDVVQLRRWCQHCNIDVRIYAVGGARIVDAKVFEFPWAVAFEADDAAGNWTSHMYSSPRPNSPKAGLTHPYQRFSETSPDGDPRGGAWQMMDVHHAQHQRLGPVLFSWSACRESDGAESVTTASATLVAMEGGGSTAWSATEPGLAVGTGGYARRQADNSEFVLRDRVAAIPVIVRVLAQSATSNGSVRVQTRLDSYIDVPVSDNNLTWKSHAGWLEVGITPDDDANVLAQLFHLRCTTAAVCVYYAGGYVPTDA